MKKLDVHFCGWGQDWLLGRLTDNDVQLLFEYSPEALRRGIEFSAWRLPLRPEACGGFPISQFRLPGLVADSLPDGWGWLLMDKWLMKRGGDPACLSPLDRLAFIGERAMGALAFRPAGDLEPVEEDLSLLQLATAAKAVVAGDDIEALNALVMLGCSPQGARPKVLVRFDPDTRQVTTREDGPGTPWLIKFPARGEHPEVCAVEYAWSIAARACGIAMPRTEHFSLGRAMSAFGVERFDRVDAGAGLNAMRVPVHSFAGALHADFRLPSLDYQTVLRATRFFTRDEVEVSRAFLRCVFNVVFHNRDDHAKNFALRMNERLMWQLSPAYDLVYSHGPRGHHQTSVMGEGLAPARSHLLALARAAQVPERLAHDALERVCDQAARLPQHLDDAGVRRATRTTIAAAVRENLRRCTA
jgi:serine/threonine-protein kinase HipA